MSAPRPVLLVDGDCAFCAASVEWLRRHGLLGVPAVPWQTADLAALGVDEARLAREAVLVLPGGDTRGGARALAYAARRGPSRLAPLAALADAAPVRPLARAVYRRVARNRARLPGGTAACAVRTGRPDG